MTSAVFKICARQSVNVTYNLRSLVHCMQSVILSLQSANVRHRIKEDKQVAVILSLMENKTYGLLRNLSAPAIPSSLSLKTIVEPLQKSKPLLIAERFRFHKRNQLEGETVRTYIAELKKLTLYCEFGASLNYALRDRLV